MNFGGAEIQAIANGLDPRVKVVVSAHTHAAVHLHDFGGKLVTSASSFGRLITSIDLRIDHESKQIVEAKAENHDRDPGRREGPGPRPRS